ncbi:MAG: metallophosphoesterase [Oscillospiraceae bacterium]|nr:metallophosphoesterase [Oscillospiraceae bacterium]
MAYILMTSLIAWRVWKMLSRTISGFCLRWYLSTYGILCVLFPLGFFLPKSKFSKLLQTIGNYWNSLELILLFAVSIEWPVDVLLVHLLKALQQKQMAFVSLVVFGTALITFLYGAIHHGQIKIKEYQCAVNKQKLPGDSLRIVQLSDIHLSSINDLRKIKKIVSMVNTLSADYICITGDTFTENTREVFDIDVIASELRKLYSKYGVFACLGNHDAGKELPKMKKFFHDADIKLLEDSSIFQDGILLLGRSDMTPGGDMNHNRPSFTVNLRDVARNNLIIVMDHQPGAIESCAKAGVDILLSGHTHGGQFFPLNLLIRHIFPHYHGCRKFGQMYSIVSPGTCTPVPYIRAIGDSEIILINVVAQDE